jgi:hypothetical protein
MGMIATLKSNIVLDGSKKYQDREKLSNSINLSLVVYTQTTSRCRI